MTNNSTTADFVLTVPVALICFNRPEQTARVMETLRQARPPRLYIIADGSRANIPGEAERCRAVRTVATAVDWPCDVVTDFAQTNMGCRDRIISGLNACFAREEQLIVLEDDCVAHPDFFRFCQEMLDRYRQDGRVFAVSGDNFQAGTSGADISYYFSRIFHCWGWASWRDRWQSVDFAMSEWPKLRDSRWLSKTIGVVGAEHYRQAFDQTYNNGNSSWAYRASLASLTGGRVNILPGANLVSNIGMGDDATHTSERGGFEALAVYPMTFPLKHPADLSVHDAADRYTFRRMSGSWRRRIKLRLQYLLRMLWRGA